jgi:hypothetical protein
MVIVVTGTIAPDAKVGQLKIRDSSERLAQYKSGLERLLASGIGAGTKVVFCDNSGFGTEEFEDLKAVAGANKVEFEAVSFAGDKEAVAAHGKGYGEGEIVDYVLDNSRLAHGEKYLIKITGRLLVDNIADIARRVREDRVYFNVPNIHRRDMYDTRLYAMPVSLYREVFSEAAGKVDDGAEYFLEYAFTDAVLDNNISVKNFPKYPRIKGVSGSGGNSYDYTEWKCKIRDFLSIFNIYSKIRKDKG